MRQAPGTAGAMEVGKRIFTELFLGQKKEGPLPHGSQIEAVGTFGELALRESMP